MAYELFTSKATRFSPPELTIRSGRIFLNAAIGDVLAKLRTEHVHIFWDAPARKIAIKPVMKENENSFRVSIASGKRGGTISAQSFLQYIRWVKKGDPVTVPAQWNSSEAMFEADLPKGRIAV